jgi:iron complex outermembrane recepter protein
MSRKVIKRALSCAVASSALVTAIGGFTPALAQIEEIVVTSQRKEQSIQTIPISVTAFDASALEAQQIEDFSDLQFNTPNVNFTKGNFGGGNFQIRGIGSASIAASGDGGVGMHMNEVPLRISHLFDMEYYDVERVEVMRGPQGTLFGRNSTGGAVNVISIKPSTEGFEGRLAATVGNFDTRKLRGSLNIPLGDTLAIRLAGSKLDRDGYTQNVHTGNAIDGRDQFSYRATARWEATDRTTFDVMYQFFEEGSSRVRGSKQLCNRDPSALYGCLPDKLAFGTVNSQSNWPNLFASSLIVGPVLAIQGAPFDPTVDAFGASGIGNPADLRKVALDFDPTYNSEDKFVTWGATHEFDRVTMNYIGSWLEAEDNSTSDYNQAVADSSAPNPVTLGLFPISSSFIFPDGVSWPTSTVTPSNTGSVGGNLFFSDAPSSFDLSRGSASQKTHELRFQSDLEGDVNWLIGAFYMETEGEGDYFVNSSAFDYLSMLMGPIWLQGAMASVEAANPGTLAAFGLVPADLATPFVFDGVGMVAPMFNAETKDNTLETWAVFGETYWQIKDDLKITLGLRYTSDKKSITNRSTGFDQSGIAGDCLTCVQPYDPSVIANAVPGTPLFAAIQIGLIAPFDTPVGESYTTMSDSWNALTGRLAFDWSPELDFTDATLIYGSVSRGYKGGGFNPAVSGELGAVQTFDPEFILAYELGMKNDFADNRIRWNMTGFYYDYEGLQVAKITNRSAANENVDATIWGLESEMFIAPTENLLFNVNFSYLKTEVQEFLSIDPRDVTGGMPASEVALIKDPTSGAQCVINRNGGTALDAPGQLNTIAGLNSAFSGFPLDPAGLPNFQICNDALMAGVFGFMGEPYTATAGIEQDMTGNSLPNSPEFSMTIGGQYTHYFESGSSLVSRIDYFRQDDMWGRINNRNPIDRIASWSQLNASVTYAPEEENWQIKAFVQNMIDDDNVTGMYVTDPAAGLFTNVFVLEPRIYGFTVDVRF